MAQPRELTTDLGQGLLFSKSFQVLFIATETIIVLTLIILQ